jgi:hypothetical protein
MEAMVLPATQDIQAGLGPASGGIPSLVSKSFRRLDLQTRPTGGRYSTPRRPGHPGALVQSTLGRAGRGRAGRGTLGRLDGWTAGRGTLGRLDGAPWGARSRPGYDTQQGSRHASDTAGPRPIS